MYDYSQIAIWVRPQFVVKEEVIVVGSGSSRISGSMAVVASAEVAVAVTISSRSTIISTSMY